MMPKSEYTGTCFNSPPAVHVFSFHGIDLSVAKDENPTVLYYQWFLPSLLFSVTFLLLYFIRNKSPQRHRIAARGLLRSVREHFRKKNNYVVFKERGKYIRIHTHEICFVKASGNYIEIQTDTRKYVARHKIGGFLDLVPEPLEFLRISRSSIVRLDKIQEKSRREVTVRGEKIAVGETYLGEFRKIKI